MKTIEIDKTNGSLSSYADDLGEGEVLILTRDDQPVAAVVSLKNVDAESLALSTNLDFLRIVERSRDDVKAGRTSSLEEVEAEMASID